MSTPVSLPSRPIFFIDAPEIESFDAKFVYNFYAPDELTNDQINLSDYLGNLSLNSFLGRIPRYVNLTWVPTLSVLGNLSPDQSQEILRQIRTRPEYSQLSQGSNITFEDDLSSNEFLSTKIGDFSLDEKLYFEMSSSIGIHGIDGSLLTNEGKIKFLSNAKQVFENNPEIINLFSRLLTKDDLSYGVLKLANQRYLNSQMDLQDEEKKDEYFESIKTMESSISLGAKYGWNIVKNSSNDPLTPYAEDFNLLIDKLKSANDVLNRSGLGVFNQNVYNPSLRNPILMSENSSELLHPQIIPVGYFISKIEILQDGSEKKHDSIFIENTSTSRFIDKNIRYGSEYIYSIRTIFFLKQSSNVGPGNQWRQMGYFLSSKPSSGQIVKTIENIAPPPPVDLNIFWDYERDKLTLSWNFPTNPQRDIKKFQIFRRESIQHPFELISEKDFSDEKYPSVSLENPSPDIVQKTKFAEKYFQDEDFTKKSSYIYALCSVDAHGMSSNYGIQIQASFDKYKNEIVKKTISHRGAPKPYPNLYLPGKGMIDVAHVNGHSSKRLFVYFSPQGYKLFDNNDQLLDELQTQKTNGHYEFNFINVDNLKNQILKINLRDLME